MLINLSYKYFIPFLEITSGSTVIKFLIYIPSFTSFVYHDATATSTSSLHSVFVSRYVSLAVDREKTGGTHRFIIHYIIRPFSHACENTRTRLYIRIFTTMHHLTKM